MRELRITQKGAILLSKTINSPLIFTNMALGSGVLESWDDSIEGMIAQVLKEAVSDVNVSNGQITFRTVFKNESLEIGFYVNEIGVFAQDPDEGEILFAYTNSFGEETDYMEKGTGSKIIKYIIDIAMAFTNNVEVQLLVDPSKNYISVDKIANDLDTDDPSKVLAAPMGKTLQEQIIDVKNNKINLYVGETLPEIRDRNKKTIYCKVTDTISASNTTENIKVSPLMGIKLV